MKKIFFPSLLFCMTTTLLKAQAPPQRTTDPSPAHPAAVASLPMKSGGGTTIKPTVQMAPLRNADGGGAGKGTQGQGFPHPALNQANAANARTLAPSELAVRRDSLQKH